MRFFVFIGCALLLFSCKTDQQATEPAKIVGTWKLQTGTLIDHGDTTVTDYTKATSFIKIINDTHFAFLQHDLNKGKDSAASFVAGGGTYSFKDSSYTENLEYCTASNWEGNSFKFTVTIKGDTLVQRGVEKVDSAGVNRMNIEQYVRLKQ
ncbi:MAG: lipocalin-like domain-containing protein [Chitinophagaceae bacterium]|nr:lipocalin-like domain-containing protein [Chitinophagaceae bacterium]